MNDGFYPGMLMGFVVGFAVASLAMDTLKVVPMKSKAIELGAAEWKVDPKTGSSTFTWIEKNEKTKSP